MSKFVVASSLLLSTVWTTFAVAQTRSFTFTEINAPFPGTVQTVALGINSQGDIVGTFGDAAGTHGFVLQAGVFTAFDAPFPGANDTIAFAINSQREIVGRYDANGRAHGFLLKDGEFSSFDAPCPRVVDTIPFGINNAGQIVGLCFTDNGFVQHGFLLDHGQYSAIDFPGAQGTAALGINSHGQIVGYYGGGDNSIHAFVEERGTYTPLAQSIAHGINDRGEITCDNAILERGVSVPFAVPFPGALDTIAQGINDRGEIVGIYGTAGGQEHGFLATPARSSQ